MGRKSWGCSGGVGRIGKRPTMYCLRPGPYPIVSASKSRTILADLAALDMGSLQRCVAGVNYR